MSEILTLFVLAAVINYKESPTPQRVQVFDDSGVIVSKRRGE